MKPDISVTKMGPEAVLSNVITLMHRDGLRTLVVDCWYFSRGVLESYHDIAITVVCGSDDMPNMVAIATSGLRRNQYRIFACGPLVASVFADVADFRVLSTAFTYTASPSNVVIARTGMNTSSLPTIGEILHTTPLISESGFRILCGLSSADANTKLNAVCFRIETCVLVHTQSVQQYLLVVISHIGEMEVRTRAHFASLQLVHDRFLIQRFPFLAKRIQNA